MEVSFEWIEAAPSADEASEVTVARLEIHLDGLPITRVADSRSQSVRDAIIVPLLPLCEWIVANWWSLFFEVDTPGASQRVDGFLSRHDLSYAGDGFAFPSLRICSLGDYLQLRASRYAPLHSDVEFLRDRELLIDRESVQAQFRGLIDAVLERLQSHGIRDTWLEQEWTSINQLDESEREFCRAAALVGLDPLSVPDDEATSIVKLWNETDPCIREDMFMCAEADELSAVVDWIHASTSRLSATASGSSWTTLRDQLPLRTQQASPWDQGYRLARQARERMGLAACRVEFDSSGEWAVSVVESETPVQTVDGLVAVDGPSLVTGPKHETALRFARARAIDDYLGGGQRTSPSLLTSASTCRQQQARAFAAEYLSPSAILSQRIGDPSSFVSSDTMDELASDFGVSSYVIRHQITNHALGNVLDSV